ncbi:MAG: type II secretion system F family protein [Coriobacteriia bacterium]|nr:type II secretion system F family protein [Coriobacteriia bacterium]MCL2745555.1 type II secretion system F family protein [Coriobacteriia bacterium]MCL2870429.1 type II secretion system F family protein [Coriobacteriia bacterium]
MLNGFMQSSVMQNVTVASWVFAPVFFVGMALACSLFALWFLERLQKRQEERRLSSRLKEGTLNSSKVTQREDSRTLDQQLLCRALCLRFRPGRNLLRLFDRAGLSRQSETILRWWLMAVGLGALLVLVISSAIMALVVTLLAIVISLIYLQAMTDKKRQVLRESLPDMLDELAQSLRAGRSFPQSLSFVLEAQPEDSPLMDILRRLDADVRLGRDCSKSLKDLSAEAELRELKSIAAVLEISTRVGGNTPALFEQAATSIRQDLMLNKKLRVQTAQGRSSVRLVGIVPFALIGLMSLVMPGYLGLWLSSSGGQFLFGLALCLITVGFLWVRSVVNIYV